MCQNGGTLDEGNCTCNCAGGFSGPNCESECIVMRLAPANVLFNFIHDCSSYGLYLKLSVLQYS